jgi:hypothetical protein
MDGVTGSTFYLIKANLRIFGTSLDASAHSSVVVAFPAIIDD